MSRISDALFRPQIPTALLIGGGQELLDRCQAAAMDAGIAVKACPVSMAAALAEERRPVVIVITQSVYALDPDGFETMAREVMSTLVRLDQAVTEREIEVMLAAAARESRKQRARHSAPGRYSLVPADDEPVAPRSHRTAAVAAPAEAVARRHEVEAAVAPRSERWGSPVAAAELGYQRRDTPAPSSYRAPPSSRRAQFPVDIEHLLDERGLPRVDPRAK